MKKSCLKSGIISFDGARKNWLARPVGRSAVVIVVRGGLLTLRHVQSKTRPVGGRDGRRAEERGWLALDE